MSRRRSSAKAPLTFTAKKADKHVLYEASVQDTEADIHFITRVFKKERGRKPLSLREDFCGTARLCADWVKTDPGRTAVGLDLHQPTLDWGTRRHLSALDPEAARRVQLLRRNVLEGVTDPVDVTVAFNFSYCVFKERRDLLAYSRRVHHDLVRDGAFMLDIHGGTESFEELEETQKHYGFTYVWDQGPYDAINGYGLRHIHFRFPDGTELRRAFTYDWRIWTLPELRDILLEAGFSRVDVYWEGADDKGRGNGIFRKTLRADNEASWIAYVIGWR